MALGTEACKGSGDLGAQQALVLPALDADQLVLSQPFLLLVILMNISLNTLPALAFRFLQETVKKPLQKVRPEATGQPVSPFEQPTQVHFQHPIG